MAAAVIGAKTTVYFNHNELNDFSSSSERIARIWADMVELVIRPEAAELAGETRPDPRGRRPLAPPPATSRRPPKEKKSDEPKSDA